MKKKSSEYWMQKGWRNKDPKRDEFYASLLNDIAEDIEAPKRKHSKENLLEVIGYMHRVQECINNRFQGFKGDILSVLSKDMAERWNYAPED